MLGSKKIGAIMATTKNAITLYSSDESKWTAVVTRDARADGHFVYAVKTTGVFAHPSAPFRLPKRENVDFFNTSEEAECAGYRLHRRTGCDKKHLNSRHLKLVLNACRIIESSDQQPKLEALAEQVGLSTTHFHRIFKKHTGLTPKKYASAIRAKKLRNKLRRRLLPIKIKEGKILEGDLIKFNNSDVGRIIIHDPFPFALVKVTDPNIKEFLKKDLVCGSAKVEITKPEWINL